jgi:hypothetical protein
MKAIHKDSTRSMRINTKTVDNKTASRVIEFPRKANRKELEQPHF